MIVIGILSGIAIACGFSFAALFIRKMATMHKRGEPTEMYIECDPRSIYSVMLCR